MIPDTALAFLFAFLSAHGELRTEVNRGLATAIKRGDTMARVESLIGSPYARDSYGPPGQYVTVHSYPGATITYNTKKVVTAVR